MENNLKRLSVFIILTVLFVTSIPLFAQDQYFDTDTHIDDKMVLTICYPTLYSINSVLGLQKEGLLPVDDLIIVGIYHEDEISDYYSAREFIERESLGDHFFFHKVSGSLTPENVYQKNPCSDEFKRIFKQSDAIIFFGGADMPPQLYGRKTNLLSGLRTPYRHYFELSLIFHLLGGFQNDSFPAFLKERPGFPVLGLCLGEQSLNVGTGGTLIQDIWSETYKKKTVEDVIKMGRESWHNNPWPKLRPLDKLLRYNMHRIKLKKDGKLVKELGFTTGDFPYIVSSHHQMAEKLGKHMRVIATSMDGKVIEAIEHETFPNVLGLQFHPEFASLWERDAQYRIDPDDTPGSLRSILEKNPPSFAFHKKIWGWFTEKMQESSKQSK